MKQGNHSHLFQVVGHLEFAFLRGNVGLDFRVGVVDDCQEHVEQDEEDEEDVENEICWTENAVCLLQSLEVEVAEDDTEQRETVDSSKVKFSTSIPSSVMGLLFAFCTHFRKKIVV